MMDVLINLMRGLLSQRVCVCVCVCVHTRTESPSPSQLFTTPWTAACQASLSMGFPRQEDWSGLPCSPSGDLSIPGMESSSFSLQEDSLPTEPPGNHTHTAPQLLGFWLLFILH